LIDDFQRLQSDPNESAIMSSIYTPALSRLRIGPSSFP
jgi:hypothetical protein